MPAARDHFCHACGAAFPDVSAYPRACTAAGCGTMVWANPIPVAVALVPVLHAGRQGLLVIRRGIPPHVGRLALVGGFLEAHERWQDGAAREVFEETGVRVDPERVVLQEVVSSQPRPERLLLFAVTAPVDAAALPPLPPNPETQARGAVFGPDDLDELLAWPLHAAAARRWFVERGLAGPGGYVEL